MGLNSNLANDEVAFLILEGAMVAIAVIALSVFHPGFSFQGLWSRANFQILNRRSEGIDSPRVIGVEMGLDPCSTHDRS